MIGKAGIGNHAIGILDYCYYEKEKLSLEQKENLTTSDVRGEIIYLQNLALDVLHDGRYDMDYLAKQFTDIREMNKNLNNYVWHQSFSFPQGENPTNDQIQEIAQKFSKDFGFEKNQMLVFRHADKKHAHFHIVANRLNANGKNTANDSKNYQRTGVFCRKIEQEMGLQITQQMFILEEDLRKKREKYSESKLAELLREKIEEQLKTVSTIEELKGNLKKEGIKTHLGRGIAFTIKDNGVTFKGSDLGREFSLQNLEKRIENVVSKEHFDKNQNKSFDNSVEMKSIIFVELLITDDLMAEINLPNDKRKQRKILQF